MPSPSDDLTEIVGSLTLSRQGVDSLNQEWEWVEVGYDSLPDSVKAQRSDKSSVFISDQFNKSFDKNPNFVHAFVTRSSMSDPTIYFYIRDMDHPIP